MTADIANLSPARKVAILLVTLGATDSAEILRRLNEREIEQVTVEIARLGNVEPNVVEAVLDDFVKCAGSAIAGIPEADGFARDLLAKVLGPERAAEMLERHSLEMQTFRSLRRTDPRQVTDFLRKEHPQTVAIVLASIDREMAAAIINELPEDVRAEAVRRLALMETANPEVLREVDRVLERRLSAVFAHDAATMGGVKAVADIVNHLDTGVEKDLFERLEPVNAKLAEEVRALMFTFEDLVRLDDRAMQRVLKDVDGKDLALAMKAATEAVSKKIFGNMSERAQNMLKQEIDYLGPVRLSDVQHAQTNVVRAVRALEEAGEIVTATAGDVVV